MAKLDPDLTVRQRAANRCEYCRISQRLQGAIFHIEHIVPRTKDGTDDLENLALACPSCNLRKSDRVEAPDPRFGTAVPLFHPRRDKWGDHFFLHEGEIQALTAVGRATAAALDFNHPRRLRIRQIEQRSDDRNSP
ncbi:MAG: HNH endonuclease [Verrucomicrobiae bacterium]|nr:HNH endonuclease [Verrucomicrobiae bacterium]MCP5541896.1 HNH endonuclease [Akkermansiaceae bacterium]